MQDPMIIDDSASRWGRLSTAIWRKTVRPLLQHPRYTNIKYLPCISADLYDDRTIPIANTAIDLIGLQFAVVFVIDLNNISLYEYF